MKKIVVYLVLAIMFFTLNSCSNSDDSPKYAHGIITMKVDGVYKSFSKILFDLSKSPDGSTTSVAFFTEDDGDDYGDHVSFTITKGVFTDLVPFGYYIEQEDYARASGFEMHLTSNGNDKKVIGTFSGDVSNGTETFTITEGTFNIQY
ncbi:MAG TPA: hypothetical protein PKN96_10650 [Flavobacterium sp.]|uniref:hypothetical protein n=1 Tax=Flavobacterium sp. TaxID=239 RepID=UPI002C7D24D2|nr:hypothetical protein [Flavobacterium sp.]HNP33740.1 hypothetical protein [Flavobacterium sp.]